MHHPVRSDRASAGPALEGGLPAAGQVPSEWGGRPEAGDDDLALRAVGHDVLLVVVRSGAPPDGCVRAQPCALWMYETASPTVLRFLTSSSGIRTPNFSSAFTTIVIIDSESMSRSSVKLLSSSTDSTGRPVSSFTISARPLRISCSLLAMRGAPSFVARWCVPEGPVGRRGTVDVERG